MSRVHRFWMETIKINLWWRVHFLTLRCDIDICIVDSIITYITCIYIDTYTHTHTIMWERSYFSKSRSRIFRINSGNFDSSLLNYVYFQARFFLASYLVVAVVKWKCAQSQTTVYLMPQTTSASHRLHRCLRRYWGIAGDPTAFRDIYNFQRAG